MLVKWRSKDVAKILRCLSCCTEHGTRLFLNEMPTTAIFVIISQLNALRTSVNYVSSLDIPKSQPSLLSLSLNTPSNKRNHFSQTYIYFCSSTFSVSFYFTPFTQWILSSDFKWAIFRWNNCCHW